jgi:hypothetical protein
MEKAYGIRIEADDVDRAAFKSATTLARMVAGQLQQLGSARG